jgi:hypothetical protein
MKSIEKPRSAEQKQEKRTQNTENGQVFRFPFSPEFLFKNGRYLEGEVRSERWGAAPLSGCMQSRWWGACRQSSALQVGRRMLGSHAQSAQRAGIQSLRTRTSVRFAQLAALVPRQVQSDAPPAPSASFARRPRSPPRAQSARTVGRRYSRSEPRPRPAACCGAMRGTR